MSKSSSPQAASHIVSSNSFNTYNTPNSRVLLSLQKMRQQRGQEVESPKKQIVAVALIQSIALSTTPWLPGSLSPKKHN